MFEILVLSWMSNCTILEITLFRCFKIFASELQLFFSRVEIYFEIVKNPLPVLYSISREGRVSERLSPEGNCESSAEEGPLDSLSILICG